MMTESKLPTLVDNAGENQVLDTLRQLIPEAKNADVATGFFEIGALLALDGFWQRLGKLRVLMGDETTRRTRRVIVESLRQVSERSLEHEKELDDSLAGLPAIREALTSGVLLVRAFSKAKFHAKTYIFNMKPQQLSNYALVGSSNFTRPGLTENLELNLLTSDQLQVKALADWFEQHWQQGESVRDELAVVIERHLREWQPFEIWAKALVEYFGGRERTATVWEETESVIYRELNQYQKDGYHQALRIADRWGGALVCDGVGLGKTFVGLMLLEYHLQRGERVLLICPKSTMESVWNANIERWLEMQYELLLPGSLHVRAMTDFGREGGVSTKLMNHWRKNIDAVIIDEAHHFRTPHSSRSKALLEVTQGKRVYQLTATPINNSLHDLRHLIEYFSRGKEDYFRSIGVHHLQQYFARAEKAMEEATGIVTNRDGDQPVLPFDELAQQQDLLRNDALLKAVVIQRSRAYVKESEGQRDGPLFPRRLPPTVIPYSLKKVYAGLYDDLKTSFSKKTPLLKFAVYNPEAFRIEKSGEQLNREKQLLGLIRTMFLKRLESSYKAFEASAEDLLRKMAGWLQAHSPAQLEQWIADNAKQWKTIQDNWKARQEQQTSDEAEEDNDLPPPRVQLDPNEFQIDGLVPSVLNDMTELAKILAKVYAKLSPDKDDKLQQLLKALRTDERLAGNKVVIFTEFRDTARYLLHQLREVHKFADVEELDSNCYWARGKNREVIIKRFAPHYNCTDAELPKYVNNQIHILISTDVLSEGLNLQDANFIVNYDVHWNPVRLMQRVGRVDRRLNPDIERRLGRDPSQPLDVHVFNFLPPDEIDDLLGLLKRVTGKVMRISKTLGIEAPVLRPDDEFEALRLFNEGYEGQKSVEEELRLELHRLQGEHPDLFKELPNMPLRARSGKRAGADGTNGLFCCYRFPPIDPPASEAVQPPSQSAIEPPPSGEVRWYFRCARSGEVWESDRLGEIADAIRSQPDTSRVRAASWDELKQWRLEIEKQKVNAYLRDLQAPAGTKATLLCWMEVC